MVKINSLYEASFKPLSRETEGILARKAKNGDVSARETLIRANIRFALSEARKYQGHGLDWDDLCSVAVVGLIKAVDHFNPDRNVRFITCAVQWIKNEVLSSINGCGYTQKLSSNDFRTVIKLRKNLRRHQHIENENERLELAAESTEISVSKAEKLLKANSPNLSFDAPEKNKSDSGSAGTFLDMIADTSKTWPEDAAVNACFRREFYKTLNSLSNIDRGIFLLYNGIAGYKTHSFTQIGEKIGRSRQWVFLREKKIERHLSELLKDWIA